MGPPAAIPYRHLFLAILLFCCIGAYSIGNSGLDVAFAAAFGVLGYVFPKLDCEPAPLLLGFVLGPTRAEALPDVPTVAEAGFPGTEMDSWWGAFAPAGTPQPVLEQLNAAITETMTSPAAAEFLAKQGAIPTSMSQPEFAAHVASEITKWRGLAESHGIKAERAHHASLRSGSWRTSHRRLAVDICPARPDVTRDVDGLPREQAGSARHPAPTQGFPVT